MIPFFEAFENVSLVKFDTFRKLSEWKKGEAPKARSYGTKKENYC